MNACGNSHTLLDSFQNEFGGLSPVPNAAGAVCHYDDEPITFTPDQDPVLTGAICPQNPHR